MTPLGHFNSPSARLRHVHIDIIGPLPVCRGFSYCLTAIDRYTRWPEVWPMVGITAEEVADTFLRGWIARFGVPSTVTTDQGRQFESDLFQRLLQHCATKRTRTTSYHPCANGMIERVHRQLKAALTCHEESWINALPLVLLGMRAALKEDVGTSCAELLYGEALRLPGEMLVPAPPSGRAEDVADFVVQLRRKMAQVRPIPASRHACPSSFQFKDLPSATHVFLRDDTVRRPLTPPYSGPHLILARKEKTIVLGINGREVEVSLDRVKPAHLEVSSPPASSAAPSPVPAPAPRSQLPPTVSTPTPVDTVPTQKYTTRSGRQVRFAKPFDL